MRILMVSPTYFPVKGGAESVIRMLSEGLNQSGIETNVLTFNMDRKWNPYHSPKVEIQNNVKIIKIPSFNWLPIAHSIRMTQGINLIPYAFKETFQKYDIIHFHVGDLTFPFFSRHVKKPKLAQFHGPLSNFKQAPLGKAIIKSCANRYIAISRMMEKEFLMLGIPESRVDYLPNAIDTKIFHSSGKKQDNLVIFVGRVTFDKGVHVLLESLSMIKTSLNLVIIGPMDYDQDYIPKIKTLISKENKKGIHNVFYVGEQEPQAIANWCKKASLLVLPSFREASSVVSLEALSCKTPVVGTNIGGVPEIVLDGKTGILVPPNDPHALAKSIEYIINNRKIRDKFGINGRKLVEENFSKKVIVPKLISMYSQLLT